MAEIVEKSAKDFELLLVAQMGCRLLVKPFANEPAGKKSSSRVKRSVVTESNVTSVCGDEIVLASVDSSLRGKRQI